MLTIAWLVAWRSPRPAAYSTPVIESHLAASLSISAFTVLDHELAPNPSTMPTLTGVSPQTEEMSANWSIVPTLPTAMSASVDLFSPDEAFVDEHAARARAA